MKRGSGPKLIQAANARTADAITVGTNQPATRSASRWIGARERCARATMSTIRASMVSRPTFSAESTSPPFWLTVPPITRAPSVFDTGIDSPVTMDSSTKERPSVTTPSTGIFSPGRTRKQSPTAISSIATSSSP